MTAEQRELEEGGKYRNPLLQKLESYLRSHFSGDSLDEVSEGGRAAARELLLQAARDWCLNRGLKMSERDIEKTADEAMERHMELWRGREESDGKAGDRFGKGRGTDVPSYGGSLA